MHRVAVEAGRQVAEDGWHSLAGMLEFRSVAAFLSNAFVPYEARSLAVISQSILPPELDQVLDEMCIGSMMMACRRVHEDLRS